MVKIYLTGGAIRDMLLGITPKDKDYVVCGTTPEAMVSRGYTQVGIDFPVFLHPTTGEEYALARTERKIGTGYHGFVVDATATTTLGQDLGRRDLSMNSMAIEFREDGNYNLDDIIDPFNGRADLQQGILRHTSSAFREDPVRILRVARFAARYNFTVDPHTMVFMQEMVSKGEFDSLEQFRVWQEIRKGLQEAYPARMFQVLEQCGALQKIGAFQGGLDGQGLYLTEADLPLRIKFACIATEFGITNELFDFHKIPTECRDLAKLVNHYGPTALEYNRLTSESKIKLISICGGIGSKRNTTLCEDFLTVVQLRASFKFKEPQVQDMFDNLRRDRDHLLSQDMEAVIKASSGNNIPIHVVVNQHFINVLESKQK